MSIHKTMTILASAAILAGALPALASSQPVKVVFHVNFDGGERQQHALKNASNVVKEAGPGATIEVVCHGPGIKLVTRESPAADQVAQLSGQGVRFVGCENTLREKKIPRESLLKDVTTVPSGAVEVIRRQQEGFAYFRP